MKLVQKWLLGLALTGLLGGVFLTVCRARFPDVLTIVLPLGATFGGLFLITYIFRDEAAKFDAEERQRIEAARSYRNPDAEKSKRAKKNRSDTSESIISRGGSAGVVPENPKILSSKPLIGRPKTATAGDAEQFHF
jgi:hypothetical protein